MASSASSGVPTLYVLNRNYSSWSLRAWLVVRHLKIDFETEVLLVGTPEIPDLGLPKANELMLRAGPTGKVPSLHVPDGLGGKHIVFESLAIVEYLAEGNVSMRLVGPCHAESEEREPLEPESTARLTRTSGWTSGCLDRGCVGHNCLDASFRTSFRLDIATAQEPPCPGCTCVASFLSAHIFLHSFVM